MSEDEAFVRLIRASPLDESNRLVYADWLQERDDPRAEFLRVESALAALILQKRRDDALAARYLDLSLALPEAWVTTIDRVPKLLRPSVKDGKYYLLTPRRGETMMFLLTGLFGAPAAAKAMNPEEVLRAVRENRALTFDVTRDGFGGGAVWVRRPEPQPAEWAGSDAEAVFPCVVTDAILECLRRNSWERIYEVFEPG